MIFPENIYPASMDPMHYSHKNTILTAVSYLNKPVTILICQNGLKDSGMFTIEERLEIAKLYLPHTEIVAGRNDHEICDYLTRSKRIVRGIRSREDLAYAIQLINFYGIKNIYSKALLINVPEKYMDISSTGLKKVVMQGDYKTAKQYALDEVVIRIKNKLSLNFTL